MYIVKIENGEISKEIHGQKAKLTSGKVVQGINTIDSFTFSMLPNNEGFPLINEFTTLVTVYNDTKRKYEFIGRVLYAETTMDENGLITKNVTCESIMGYLCDSQQTYVDTQNWTVAGLLQHLLDCHNSQVESYKQIKLGTVTAKDSNDNLYQAVQRENTWNAIKSKLIDIIGGELKCRIESDGIYLDYLDQIGEEKTTEIALSVNMKAITREQDPSAFITRLIPLGCKQTANGEETEQRLDITSVNGGKNYIDDEQAIAVYGIHVGVVEWDDVTNPDILFNKGKAWLKENNRVQVKYSISALDLSLIGLAVDDFEVGNTHPIKNGLIGVNDTARVIKKTVDVCEESGNSSIEVGDSFKTLSDIQREQAEMNKAAAQKLKELSTANKNTVLKLYELNQKLEDTAEGLEESFSSEIEQLSDSISMEVTGTLGSEASIILSVGDNKYTGDFDLSQVRKAFANDNTAISISAGIITFNSGTIVINSTNFQVDSTGNIKASNADIEGKLSVSTGRLGADGKGWTIDSNSIFYGSTFASASAFLCTGSASSLTIAGHTATGWVLKAGSKFGVTSDGSLYCTSANLSGTLTSTSSYYKAQLNSGGLKLYYNDVLCGNIDTRYHAAQQEGGRGIALRLETGGKYIMFVAPYGNSGGVTVDYYLNNGFSTNYGERHIFQTSARFLDEVYFSGSGAYFHGLYLYNSSFIKSVDSSGNVGEEMLGYSSDRVTVGSVGCATMLRGTTVYLKNTSTTVTSDRNAKNSIEALPEAYETFLDALDPVRFKFNEGTSGRYHVGYIAQNVEAALTAAGLSTMDFAGYVDIDRTGELGLIYDEFISLLHLKIKKLEQRIAAFETKYGTESVNT